MAFPLRRTPKLRLLSQAPKKTRKLGTNDDRVPIDPEEFWPDPAKKAALAVASPSVPAAAAKDDDSATETESEPETWKIE